MEKEKKVTWMIPYTYERRKDFLHFSSATLPILRIKSSVRSRLTRICGRRSEGNTDGKIRQQRVSSSCEQGSYLRRLQLRVVLLKGEERYKETCEWKCKKGNLNACMTIFFLINALYQTCECRECDFVQI